MNFCSRSLNNSLVEELDLCILWFQDYTKEFIKTCSISPDAYIQLALQLTYFRYAKQNFFIKSKMKIKPRIRVSKMFAKRVTLPDP